MSHDTMQKPSKFNHERTKIQIARIRSKIRFQLSGIKRCKIKCQIKVRNTSRKSNISNQTQLSNIERSLLNVTDKHTVWVTDLLKE